MDMVVFKFRLGYYRNSGAVNCPVM